MGNVTRQCREVTLIEWVGVVSSVARHKPSEKGKTMPISMNTASSRCMSHSLGNFFLEIRKRLAKMFERLGCTFSAIVFRRMAERELNNREAQRCELGYESRKRALLITLRHKISEKQAKII